MCGSLLYHASFQTLHKLCLAAAFNSHASISTTHVIIKQIGAYTRAVMDHEAELTEINEDTAVKTATGTTIYTTD
ncbi:hypothetical protein E2C01_088644 [Portunus trituberculatus]|uniref:Uncharacterized protein n=1 Tax=Portunus trituberculatus TaxID=210409 RepID=A0A5B7JBA9_PORTR|nr:hypothetical protein [Portunus trituberculatus]